MNIYLIVIGILLIFIGINISKFKPISHFTPVNIPDLHSKERNTVKPFKSTSIPVHSEPNIYLQDTRKNYSTLPPVNPIAKQSIIKDNIQVSPDLYINQTYDSKYTLVNSPPPESANELYYSGGTNQLIQIPLQYNNPYEPEQLRSQDILITPYNRIKYSSGGNCSDP